MKLSTIVLTVALAVAALPIAAHAQDSMVGSSSSSATSAETTSTAIPVCPPPDLPEALEEQAKSCLTPWGHNNAENQQFCKAASNLAFRAARCLHWRAAWYARHLDK